MNILSVENLSKSYGEKLLFKNINFGLSQGQKVALIAANGSGKSTLISLLKGINIPDEGRIVFIKDIRPGFLDQEPQFDEETSVADYLMDEDIKGIKLIKQFELLLEEINQKGIDKEKEKQLLSIQSEIDAENAWQTEQQIKEIVTRLEINKLSQKIKFLSGGKKKRLALAKLLIQQPDFLILDEPTNHLDQDTIEWLENMLSKDAVTLLMVTHDRYFLDNVCNRIIEIDDGQIFSYDGNFEYFLEKKENRAEAQKSETDKNRNVYRKELEWIRKMPKARGTKSKSRIEAFEHLKEKIQHKKPQEEIQLQVKMNRLGGKVLELKKVYKNYGDLKILKGFDYTFKTGEKIGIIGKNGVGKTTLLNIIMGSEQPDSGKVNVGETVIFGYYSQSGLLNADQKRVLEVVKEIADVIPMADGSKVTASQMCQMFGFNGHMQHSFVSKLSGGEKRRLFLLTVLMKNPNFLILDEPTNDLDLLTLSTLEDFLINFSGCLIVVSHDRYFLDKMADQLFVFEGEGEIRVFPGTYREYKLQKDNEKTGAKAAEKHDATKEKPEVKETKKLKMSFKEKFEFETLEKEINAMETEMQMLTESLSSGKLNHEELIKASEKITTLKNNIETKTLRWIELSELVS